MNSKSHKSTIFSFVPAHGGSIGGAVSRQLSRALAEDCGAGVLLADFQGHSPEPEAMRPLDGCMWGAFVSVVDGLQVLNGSAVHPRQIRQLLEYARENYGAICADLTRAGESYALEVLRASDGIFLVANSDAASLEGAREKAKWLRSVDLGERCGLLLKPDPNGLNPGEAEEVTGVPVCSLIETTDQLTGLAHWLAASVQTPTLAVAA